MPFKSLKQERWMYANKPELAAQWEDKYGSFPSKQKIVHKRLKVKLKRRNHV